MEKIRLPKIRLPKIRLPKIRVPKKIKWLIISLVILVGLTLFLALLWKPLFLWQLFPWLVNKIVSNTGMNIWLARALTVPIAFLLIYAISLMFSLKKKRRMTGFILLSILIFAISMTMYLFTKEHYFKFKTGESIQWYVKTPQGFRLYSAPGYDVIIEEKLKKVTPEIAKEIEIWKEKKRKNKEHEKQIKEDAKQQSLKKKILVKKPPSPKQKKQLPEQQVTRPVPKRKSEKEIEYEKYYNKAVNRQIELIRFHLITFPDLWISRDYEFDRSFELKKIADAVFQLCRIESSEGIEILIITWKKIYPIRGTHPKAAKIVSTVPVFFASLGTEKALDFIEKYLYEIELQKRGEWITTINKPGFRDIIGGGNYYNGEEVLIKIVDTLEKHLDKLHVQQIQIKDLLLFIANRASSQKARDHAAKILAQHKK